MTGITQSAKHRAMFGMERCHVYFMWLCSTTIRSSMLIGGDSISNEFKYSHMLLGPLFCYLYYYLQCNHYFDLIWFGQGGRTRGDLSNGAAAYGLEASGTSYII